MGREASANSANILGLYTLGVIGIMMLLYSGMVHNIHAAMTIIGEVIYEPIIFVSSSAKLSPYTIIPLIASIVQANGNNLLRSSSETVVFPSETIYL